MDSRCGDWPDRANWGSDAREKIFELLVRTTEATCYAAGAGIGLYVCRRLMQALSR